MGYQPGPSMLAMRRRNKIIVVVFLSLLLFLCLCFFLLLLDQNEPKSLSTIQQMLAEEGKCVIPVGHGALVIDANSPWIEDEVLIIQNVDEDGEDAPVEILLNGATFTTATRVSLSLVSEPDSAYELQVFEPFGQTGEVHSWAIPLNLSLDQRIHYYGTKLGVKFALWKMRFETKN